MQMTRSKALNIIEKTTPNRHSYFIVYKNKVIYSGENRYEAIQEIIGIIIAFFDAKIWTPKTVHINTYKRRIKECLTEHNSFTFIDWILVFK